MDGIRALEEGCMSSAVASSVDEGGSMSQETPHARLPSAEVEVL